MEGVLKISEAANLAIQAMSYLTRNDGCRVVSASRISEELGLSRDHLCKVLRILVKMGLLSSRRGPRGGFTLARSAEEVTLLQIVEALDGPLGTRRTKRRPPVMGDLQRSMYLQVHKHLSTTYLADLARGDDAAGPDPESKPDDAEPETVPSAPTSRTGGG